MNAEEDLVTTLTEDEVRALSVKYNLADGHAYRSWSAAEATVVSRAAELFTQADRLQQTRVENGYLDTFFTLSKQSLNREFFKTFFCFTASTAIEVVANLFRLDGSRVALIEPCFDNIHDILARHNVDLTVFPEELMRGDCAALESFLEQAAVDAIFLVSPE